MLCFAFLYARWCCVRWIASPCWSLMLMVALCCPLPLLTWCARFLIGMYMCIHARTISYTDYIHGYTYYIHVYTLNLVCMYRYVRTCIETVAWCERGAIFIPWREMHLVDQSLPWARIALAVEMRCFKLRCFSNFSCAIYGFSIFRHFQRGCRRDAFLDFFVAD